MDLQLSRREKEKLLQKLTDVVFADVLNREDVARILQVCLDACRRESAELEKEIAPAGGVIQ